jgi:hypothetical protein
MGAGKCGFSHLYVGSASKISRRKPCFLVSLKATPMTGDTVRLQLGSQEFEAHQEFGSTVFGPVGKAGVAKNAPEGPLSQGSVKVAVCTI